MRRLALWLPMLGLAACGGGGHVSADASSVEAGDGGDAAGSSSLRITELCAQDDGFLIDELGQTEDWI